MSEHVDLLQLVSDTLEGYLDGARQQECSDCEAAEALLDVAVRFARDVLGTRQTLAVVTAVIEEDRNRPVLFSHDTRKELAGLVAIRDDGTVDFRKTAALRRLAKTARVVKVTKD